LLASAQIRATQVRQQLSATTAVAWDTSQRFVLQPLRPSRVVDVRFRCARVNEMLFRRVQFCATKGAPQIPGACFNCGMPGHRAADCKGMPPPHGAFPFGGFGGPGPEDPRFGAMRGGPSGPPMSGMAWVGGYGGGASADVTCIKCGQKGHRMTACPNSRGDVCYLIISRFSL
jgi:hypothetical protein